MRVCISVFVLKTTMQAHMYMSPQSGSFEFMHRYLKLINHYEKQLNTQVDWIHTAIIDQQTTGRGGSASVPPHNPTVEHSWNHNYNYNCNKHCGIRTFTLIK